MYDGASSIDDVDLRILAAIAGEERLLGGLLGHNHEFLMDTGMAAKAVDLSRAVVAYDGSHGEEFDDYDAEEAYLGDDDHSQAELDRHSIPVDDITRFSLAENLGMEEPCDPTLQEGTLFVVIYSDAEPPYDVRFHEIGRRTYQPGHQRDIVEPIAHGVPEEFAYTQLEVASAWSLLDQIKREWLAGNLRHLGTSGYYDTLEVNVPFERLQFDE